MERPRNAFLHFLTYNNAVPIALGVMFLSTTAVFAASPEAREAVYSVSEEVRGVDNTYILATDVEMHDFALRIVEVVEDEDFFYVTYSYQTIAPVDYVWQRETVTNTMRVSRKEIEGLDLGLFVAKQLGEVIAAETRSLEGTQEIERGRGRSQKILTTTYSGLVGRFFSARESAFPGYTPVVAQAEPRERGGNFSVAQTASAAGSSIPPGLSREEIERLINERVNAALSGAHEEPPQEQEPAHEDEPPPPPPPPPSEEPPVDPSAEEDPPVLEEPEETPVEEEDADEPEETLSQEEGDADPETP